MENQDTGLQQPHQDELSAKKKRPTFLTVLCILTFVGSGWVFVNEFISYLTFDGEQAMETAEMIEGMAGMDNPMVEMVVEATETAIEYGQDMSLFRSLFALMGLLGAVLMFMLRRPGFLIYTIAQIGMMLTPFLLLGSNIISWITGGGSILFGGLFIIFYAANLKHMR